MTTPPLYRQLHEQLSQWIRPKDRRHLTVFAEIIAAILLSQSACMSHWLPFLSHRSCQGRSHLERLSYFLANPEITAEIFYVPILKQLLQAWAGEAMTLVLDTSVLWDEYCLIQVCLAWGGRSIPLAHQVIEHQSATVSFEDYCPVLESVKALLPAQAKVLFLADRGFEHGDLIRWLNQASWDWAIRAKCDLLIGLEKGETPMPIAELWPPAGMAHLYDPVDILGDITCNLVMADWPEAKEPWAVITSLPASVEVFSQYGKRFGGIEPHFKDYKSAGFKLISSRLRDPEALTCLILLLSVAELLAIQIGFWMDRLKQRSKLDAHATRGLSFLQLGLRQIQRLCYLQQRLPALRPFPLCNPPPAYASQSKEQLETSKIKFSDVYIFSSG